MAHGASTQIEHVAPPPSASEIELWKPGDTFLLMMSDFDKYKGIRNLGPRKEARLLHAMFYYDDEETMKTCRRVKKVTKGISSLVGHVVEKGNVTMLKMMITVL